MSKNIPEDIFINIIKYNPYDISSNYIVANSDYLKQFQKIELSIYANKIKRWWKRYKDGFILEREYIPNLASKFPKLYKKNIIHYMMFKYEKKYLKNYPNFYKMKYHININNPFPLNVETHMFNDSFTKTYDIYKFLKQDGVTSKGLAYCGL
tara:strand:- start:48 stop:503 length:456 start_codon:yes stop_codon:yes gene_type:complete